MSDKPEGFCVQSLAKPDIFGYCVSNVILTAPIMISWRLEHLVGAQDFHVDFTFGWRVHFALRRKMLNPPIARLPAILLDFINRPIGEMDCIYEANVK